MPDIKHLLIIKTPAHKVYEAVTTEEGLAGWWTKEVKANPEVGGHNEFRFGERFFNKMLITELEPNKKVSWKCIEGEDEWIDTNLFFEIKEKEDNQTELHFAHKDWREQTDFFASCNYNWGWYLRSLKDYCETGKGDPFPQN